VPRRDRRRPVEEAARAGAVDVDSFNAATVARHRHEPTAELLGRWRSANAAFRAGVRARGRHGSVDSSIGPYPSWLQAFHLAAEYATHADDIAVEAGAAQRQARTAWRVVFGRFVLAENDKAVSVEAGPPGRLKVRFGDAEVKLSDEEFVDATPPNGSGRQALHRLTGDFGDQVEVLIDVEDGEASQLGGGGYQEVRDRRRPVAALVGEEQLDFDGAVLDGRRQVLHRHGCQRRACGIGAELGGGAS
jgi:hypothetical protein